MVWNFLDHKPVPLPGSEGRIGYMLDRLGHDGFSRLLLRAIRRGLDPYRVAQFFGVRLRCVLANARREGISLRGPFAYVYVLQDPVSGKALYVGVTRDPDSRLSGHKGKARLPLAGNQGKDQWIRELLENNQEPVLRVVARVRPEHADRAERAMIAKYARRGPLFNVNHNQCAKSL